MKKNKGKLLIVLILLLTITTGCTKTLTNEKNKAVQNPETGQSLTENILCRPTNEKIIEIYKENKVDIDKLPECEDFKVTSGGYEGLWTSIFVKPLAFVILWIGKYVNSFGLALIITSILIRLIAYPITKKTAIQSELIKNAQDDLQRIEKKYANKTDQESMMKKSQEMTMVYKKNGINPLAGCLYGFIQIPLFMAFLEAINRVPALFEENFLFLQLGTTPMVALQHGHWYYLILVALIGLTTYFSFTLNSTSTPDGMKGMPKIMTGMIVLTAIFMPSALGIYWLTTNLFTVIQNLLVKGVRKFMEKHNFIGKTYDDAVSKALAELMTSTDEVIINEKEVKSGLFKGKKVEVEVIKKEDIITYLKQYIQNIVTNMGLSVNIEVKVRDSIPNFLLFSDNNAILIGKQGRTIDALTKVTRQALLQELNQYYNFSIDVSEYKENRKNDLERLARRTAREVVNSKIDAKLDPMNSYERRIIHNALTNNTKVYTESVGEEPNRSVVIKLKGE